MDRITRCYCSDGWNPARPVQHSPDCEAAERLARLKAHVADPFNNPRWYREGDYIPPVIARTVRALDGTLFRDPTAGGRSR